MAKSFLPTFGTNTTGNGRTRYFFLAGYEDDTAITTETEFQVPVRDAGVFSNMYVLVTSNSIAASSVITLRKTGTATGVTVTYTSTQTGIKEDTSNTDTFAATDTGNWQLVTGGASGTILIKIAALQFDPTTAGDCVTFFLVGVNAAKAISVASTTNYFVPNGQIGTLVTAEATQQWRARAAFTAQDFSVYVTANTRTTDTVFGTRKNTGAGGQTVTYTSGQTGAKEDTSGTDTLAAGDDYNYYCTTATATGTLSLMKIGSNLVSTAGHFAMLAGVTVGFGVGPSTTTYSGISGSWDTVAEANGTVYPRFTFTAKELGVYVSANTNAVLACTVTLRDGLADSSVIVSYAAAQTGLKNDSANTTEITSGTDKINYEITNSDVAGSVSFVWMSTLGSTAAAGTAYSQLITDALVLIDTAPKSTQRIIAQAIILTDTALKSTLRQLTETATLTDAITKVTQRILSETLTFADTIVRFIGAVRTETITLIDTTTKTIARTFTETLILVDTALKTISRTLTDPLVLSDVFAGVKITLKELLESITLNDTITRTISRIIGEVITFTDNIIRTISRTLTQEITISDVLTAITTAASVAVSIERVVIHSMYGLAHTLKNLTRSFTLYDKGRSATLNSG